MVTEQQAAALVGKEVRITWTEPDGSHGSMAGVLLPLDDPPWLVVDWGYGIKLDKVKSIEEVSNE